MPVSSVVAMALSALPALVAPAPEAAAPKVVSLEVVGNRFLRPETLLFYVQTKPGDPYDVRKLREDFRRLWDTGFLDNLQIEALDAAGGKLVRFRVEERKRVQIVSFRGSKALSTTSIEDALKEKDAQIKVDTFYDPVKARRVETIIKEMLAAQGRPFGTAKHQTKNLGASGQELLFQIDDGSKTKLKEVVFEGNQVFSDGKLRSRMKKLKGAGFWNLSWIGGRRTYTEEKWLGGEDDPYGDRGRVESYYLDRGYVTARVGNPRISYLDGKAGFLFFGKKPVKYMRIEIPVVEGEQYRMGELKFEGLTVLREPFVRSHFKLKPGEVYNDSRLRKAYEKLRDVYGSLGYFHWTMDPQRTPDPARKVVDVTVKMEEDKQYFLGQIAFTGNDSTRDKVIRREIFMNEGEVFNTEALKLSIRRVNQLGYFKPMETAPDIQPSQRADNKVDVTFKIEEQNRNQFTFGGGHSGLDGYFLNASFSTTNFLGAGETFQAVAQTGKRSLTYQLSLSEPYLFDRPITAGFDIFLRRINFLSYQTAYVGYGQQEQGMSVTGGVAVGRFTRVFSGYSYQIIDVYGLDEDAIERLQRQTVLGGSLLPMGDPSYYGGLGRRHESGVSLSIVRNTVDNPYQSRSGMRHSAAVQIVGGPLGGNVDYVKPNLESVVYLPVGRKMALGLHGQVAYIRPFGDTKTLRFYQRYFLGGETQIRGLPVHSVAPYDSNGRTLLGGNKFMLFNAEYYFDVLGPARLLLFFDAGQAYAEGQGFWWKTMSTSTGVELRFLMPVLNVPFRLIYAINPNRDYYQKASEFKFAVGTTF